MTDAGLAPGTVQTRTQNVRAVLRAAVADYLIARDPSAGVALPRRRRKEAAMTIPTPAEVGRLLDASEHAALFAVCAFAGLRLGEAAALKPDDINVGSRTLSVRRQVQRERRSAVEIKPPKAGSEREVYVPDRLIKMLQQHLDATGRREWIFADDGQDPPHQNTVGYWWRAACKQGQRFLPPTRPAALSCQRPQRCRLRCCHRPASPPSLEGNDHSRHLPPSVAHRRGPDSQGCGNTSCGLTADRQGDARRLTCADGPSQTLKRNSTTSPSAMT